MGRAELLLMGRIKRYSISKNQRHDLVESKYNHLYFEVQIVKASNSNPIGNRWRGTTLQIVKASNPNPIGDRWTTEQKIEKQDDGP